MAIQDAIAKLIEGQDLTRDQMIGAMDQIMSGGATDAQIGGFLVALRVKGETVEEIAGAAEVMREKATRVVTRHTTVVDTCGTGGGWVRNVQYIDGGSVCRGRRWPVCGQTW